ncbi:hypothetical protein [Actinoplanes subtropicus]|uniref:hypothetical protein n=1 Tax=Actinoplanes subtropicus TaxID=543632 RepID=UPI0012FAC1A4|nr:hypothetical protein [Actinoplanes subtropicus]
MVRWRGAVAMIGVLALAACAAPRSDAPGPSGSAPVTRLGHQRPSDLVGLWRVQARGEEAGAILRLGQDLSIWRRCDDLFGEWAADAAGGFLGETNGYSYECGGPKVTAPPKPEFPTPAPADWLLRAVAYRVDGANRLLLDDQGGIVARLTPSGEPSARHVVVPELYARPVLDDALRRQLAPAPALPAKLRPATAGELVGTWRPAVAGANPRQYVTIKADRSWEASDGCNGQEGRWIVDEPGAVLTIGGGSTAVGCAGQDKAPRFGLARGAGFDGTTLVLIDAQGKEVGRLER